MPSRFGGILAEDEQPETNRFGGIPAEEAPEITEPAPSRFGGVLAEETPEPTLAPAEESLWSRIKTSFGAGIDEFGAKQDFKQALFHLDTINKRRPSAGSGLYESPFAYSDENIASAQVQLDKSLKSLNTNLKQSQAAPMSETSQKLMKADSFGEAWDAFTEAPLTAIAEVGVRSLPSSLTGMIAGAVGGVVAGPAGFAAGMGTMSGLNEHDSAILQSFQEAGVDLSDVDEIRKATNDLEFMAKVKQEAAIKASVIGAATAVGGALASKTLAPAAITSIPGREAFNVAAQTAAQSGLGAGGEALGTYAATGEVRPGEIVAEAIGEGLTAPLDILAVARTVTKEDVFNSVDALNTRIQNATTLEEVLAIQEEAIALVTETETSIRKREAETINEQVRLENVSRAQERARQEAIAQEQEQAVTPPEPTEAPYRPYEFATDERQERDITPPTEAIPGPLGQEPTPVNEFQAENARIRGEDKTVWAKAKKLVTDQLRPGGLMPRSAFKLARKLAASGRLASFDIENRVVDLEKAVSSDYGKKVTKMDSEELNVLSNALKGDVPTDMPEKTRTALYAMRDYIDRFSEKYGVYLDKQVTQMVQDAEESGNPALMQAAQVKADLLSTVVGNVGQYVNRSYALFDDPDHVKNLSDETLDNARSYLEGQYVERGEVPSDASILAEQALNEILAAGVENDDIVSFFSSSKLGAKNLSILMKRKDIAPEIFAVMGEHTDPRVNFSTTATKLSRLVHTQDFLSAVREAGMGDYLFEDTLARPPAASVKMAAERSEVYSPLNGLYTTPEVAKVFKETLSQSNSDFWVNAALAGNAAVKLGATVLSPATQANNFLSNVLVTVANGDTDFTKTLTAAKNLKEYMGRGGPEVKKAYVRELIDLGVIFDGANATENLKLLSESKLDEVIPEGVKEGAGRGWHNIKMMYQLGDDFWKIVGYENKRDQLREHTDLNEDEIKVKAAETVQEQYPTYSMTGKLVQTLRRVPVVAPFLPWSSEIIRTNYKILESISKDMQDPKLRGFATSRLAKYGAAHALTYGLAATSLGLAGVSSEENEAARQLMPEYDKNANIIHLGKDDKGVMQYRNGSRMDPYAYFKEAYNAIARGENWKDSFYESSKVLLGPVITRELGMGAVMDLVSNKKPNTGAPIYKETDDKSDQAADSIAYFAKAIAPGFTKVGKNIYEAATEKKSGTGKTKDLRNEIMATFGQRVSKLDPKEALFYRTYDFKQGMSDANTTLNRELSDPNITSEQDISNAFEHSLALRQKAYEKMNKVVNSAKVLGMSNPDIRRVLKHQGIGARDATFLIRGEIPTWQPKNQAQKRALNKARLFFGPEHIQALRDRYSTLRQISRGG